MNVKDLNIGDLIDVSPESTIWDKKVVIVDINYSNNRVFAKNKSGNIDWLEAMCVKSIIKKIEQKMSKEELLERAKKDYLIGTVFNSVYGVKNEKSERKPFFYAPSKDYIAVKKEGGVIYQNGKWAEIVSKPEFVLPEKWCVRIDKWTSDIKEYIQNKYNPKTEEYIDYPVLFSEEKWASPKFVSFQSNLGKTNFIEITFEQFKQYVLKENQTMKKIIGYKVVKNLPDINVGSILSPKSGGYSYTCKDGITDGHYFKQFVEDNTEFFEPVYESQYFKIGDYIYIKTKPTMYSSSLGNNPLELKYPFIGTVESEIKNFGNYNSQTISGYGFCIDYDNKPISVLRKATEEEIEKYTQISLSGYVVSKKNATSVAFGCKTITLNELNAVKTIIELQNNKLSSDYNIFNALSSGEVTKETIDKLINLLK